MSKAQIVQSWVLFVLIGMTTSAQAKEDAPHPVQVVVNLADGSRLVGQISLTSLPIDSESLGKVTVPLHTLGSVKLSPDHESATILFRNGDKIQAALAVDAVTLSTIVGELKISLADVTEIAVFVLPGDEELKQGLAAYYPLNGDALDRSGNHNDGKVAGAVFEGNALRFAGDASTYMVVPRTESLEPTAGLTVSMWVKGVPGQEAGGGWGVLLRKSNHFQPGYFIRGGGVSSFMVDQTPGYGSSVGAPFARFDPNRWQHIVGTYSPSEGVIKNYQDGVLVNQTPCTLKLLHSGDLYIGGAVVAPDDGGFRGSVREVRIYNRALSELEAHALYLRDRASDRDAANPQQKITLIPR
ncbi:MAG: hypothetical protein GC164_06775 [Phycisphaera sp.]|nr:hypothetical protein [Phycisphaera sp.]